MNRVLILLVIVCMTFVATDCIAMVMIDQNPDNPIAAFNCEYGEWVILTREGVIFNYQRNYDQWTQLTPGPISIPVSEIQYWELNKFITFDGRIFEWDAPSRTYSQITSVPI